MKKKLKCVLLIDDDEPTNYLNKFQLESIDCAEHIEVAQSGEQALNYLMNGVASSNSNNGLPCPDLIFLDINMPAMNGWEFLKKYSEIAKERRGNVVIVMLTTSLNPDDKQKADELSAITGFENKPLTQLKLKQILIKYFSESF
jgi:CheY-like chemotaxis protein